MQQDFAFDIGDSPTVNGYVGDTGTTSLNATEVHTYNIVKFYFHVYTGVTLSRVDFDNHHGVHAASFYPSRYLFTLNGQATNYRL